MSVKFESLDHGTSVEIQNPERDNAVHLDLHQVVNYTADGAVNVHDLGVTTKIIRVTWRELRQVEKDLLEAFWQDTAQGAANLWYYRDHNEVWWNARFLTTRLEWTEHDDYAASTGTFTIDETAYPTTKRQNGIWGTEFEILLSAQGSTTGAATTTTTPAP